MTEKKNNIRNRKGFTMIELLAVIVILGIIMAIAIPAVNHLISRSKKENIESHKKALVMAAESYLQHNKNELPNDIGDSRNISAKTLKAANYLKEDIYNADKKSCMEASVVKVTKKGTKKYDYVAYLYCGNDKAPDDLEENNPTAKILFTDADGVPYNINKQNVTSAVVNIDINATEEDKNPKKEITLEGYSYIISASYDSTDKLVEIYNSGSLNANGKRNIKITRDVTEYIDITKLSYLVVTVEAYNSVGGHLKTSANSKYQDSTKPICGTTEGEPGEEEWNRNWRTKRITIKCSDGEGSGCVRDTFTKTFTKEAEKGIITIRDNAGNKTDCEVRVHLDWTRPTLKINAYKRLPNGSKGALVGSATVNNSTPTLDLNKYKDTYPTSNAVVSSGDGHWMNKAKYPDGVYFEVETNDNVKLGRGAWSENNKGLTKTSSGITAVKEKYVKEFTKGDKKTSFGLVEEGYRYGTYVLKDKALNEVTIKVTAPIDRTAPNVPVIKLYKKASGDAASSNPGKGAYPNNTWMHTWVYTEATKGNDAISQLHHYEHTTTGKTSNVTNNSGEHRNINAQGTSKIKYRAMDKAGNYSAYSAVSTIKLDRTPPKCSEVTKIGSSGGRNYSSGTWLSGNVYTSAKCSDGKDSSGCSGTIKVTTTGKTGDLSKKAKGSHTVKEEGTSTTKWYVYDNVGHETACDKITEKVDKTNPYCSTSKSHLNTTSGVTVHVSCGDGVSGVKSCPGTSTGIKSSKRYTIYDKANNKSSCSVTVYQTHQHAERTRKNATCSKSCCGYKKCRTAGCKCEVHNKCPSVYYCGRTKHSTTSSKSCLSNTGACDGWSAANCSCPAAGGHDTGMGHCTCKKTTTTYTTNSCVNPSCTCKTYKLCEHKDCGNKTCSKPECCGYTPWSAWSGWMAGASGCNTNYCSSKSRTLYS